MKLIIYLCAIIFISCAMRPSSNEDYQKEEDGFVCTVSILDSLTHKPIECIVNTSSGLSFYVSENDTLRITFECETAIIKNKIFVSGAGYKYKTVELDTNCRDTSFVIYLKQVVKDNNIYDVFPDSLNPNKRKR